MELRSGHDPVVAAPSDAGAFERRLAYCFPDEVVEDPSLNAAQKRAILAEWASDRSAIESRPTLRLLAGTTFPVPLSCVMKAREKLDRRLSLEQRANSQLQRSHSWMCRPRPSGAMTAVYSSPFAEQPHKEEHNGLPQPA